MSNLGPFWSWIGGYEHSCLANIQWIKWVGNRAWAKENIGKDPW